MGKILFLTNMERQKAMLEQAQDSLFKEGVLDAKVRTVMLHDEINWDHQWEEDFEQSDIVFFTYMGTGPDTVFLEKALEFLQENKITYVMLFTEAGFEELQYGFSTGNRQILQEYLSYGGIENYHNLLLWLGNRFCNEPCDYRAPRPLLWNGIYHPNAQSPYTDVAEYQRLFCSPGHLTVGIIFYREEWLWDDLAYQNALIEEFEKQGMNVIAVFTQGVADPAVNAPGLAEAINDYFFDGEQRTVDVLVNTMKYSLTTLGAVDPEFLKRLNLPILQAYTLLRSRKEWDNCLLGMMSMELSSSVTMPEVDGVIQSVPVAGREYLNDDDAVFLPIEERIKMLASKAKKWAKLRYTPNSEKKVGIIFHNYPATNANIGSASGLDSIESVRLLLAEMKQKGYRVDHIPEDSHIFMDKLVEHATNDRSYIMDEQIQKAEKINKQQYKRFFDSLSAENQCQLVDDWDSPPGDVFHYGEELLVPGMLNGNIFITVQPPRGFAEDPDKLYHSPDTAPTHHYLAYYYWLRDLWQADAVVHVGTHGTLEWLPGKGVALSKRCYPDLSIGDLPNIYPYWTTIIGEGIQAKRRSAACLIGHLSPPMSDAGSYEELAELEKLLDEYVHFKQNQPDKIDVIVRLIREKAQEANLNKDVPEEIEDTVEDYVQWLHSYITDIKNMQIWVGLHTLGCPPQGEDLVEYLWALTCVDSEESSSLPQTLASIYGFDYYELLEQSGKMLPDGSRTYGELVDEIAARSREIINLLSEHDFSVDKAEVIFDLPWFTDLTQPISQKLVGIAHYICQVLVPNLEKTNQELSNLLAALDGCYVEPGPGGAPTSGMLDVLPTGRNFYGIDPHIVPTPAAWEIGKMLGDQVIDSYLEKECSYPENVGIVVWATANERSHGQCIAEFLYLLGVRPVWQKGSLRVVDLEVIPIEKLGRPRIDVTARISGLFRDSMPVVVDWMDKAVQLVANLDESPNHNYVRKHALKDMQEMEQEGLDKDLAWEHACCRVFGDPLGAYGAGISDLLDSKNWESIHDLAQVYVRWGGHAYGVKAKGVFLPEMFSRRMESIDTTIHNEDNREFSMLSSDDYNAYHGGMIAAVRSLKGETPYSFCGDSSDRKKVVTRSLQEEVKRLFRGEAINPKFIEGMKDHGYKGASDLANYLAHSYHWDATSDVIEDWMYEKYADKYLFDQEMQEWMKEVNPWALQQILETLLEAVQRGLWQADEQTKQKLRDLYLDIEGELEERSEV